MQYQCLVFIMQDEILTVPLQSYCSPRVSLERSSNSCFYIHFIISCVKVLESACSLIEKITNLQELLNVSKVKLVLTQMHKQTPRKSDCKIVNRCNSFSIQSHVLHSAKLKVFNEA